MKEQEQIKAIAKLDGWNREPEKEGRLDPSISWGFSAVKPAWYFAHQLPQYLISYDAIIPAIQRQPIEVISKMIPISFRSTPAQLCESLLKATGRWTE